MNGLNPRICARNVRPRSLFGRREFLRSLKRLVSLAKVTFFFVFFLGEARTNYGSRFLAQVHCMNCRTDSKTHEPFQDLSLDIPDRLQRSRTKEQEEVCSLTYSLTRFFKVEELADSELYFCDNCMGKQRSTKRFWIHRLPNVSIVSFETIHAFNDNRIQSSI